MTISNLKHTYSAAAEFDVDSEPKHASTAELNSSSSSNSSASCSEKARLLALLLDDLLLLLLLFELLLYRVTPDEEDEFC